MLLENIKKSIVEDDNLIKDRQGNYKMPTYHPDNHYKHLCDSSYYHALIILRHYIKIVSDFYFSEKQKAKNIDLFMFTPSISSPMGPGSDSKPMPIKFGNLNTFLVDSSQFGFEPLIMNGFDKVYCYLPSMRGEDNDKRHLSQFYHCELEMKGGLDKLLPIIENYVKTLSESFLLMDNIMDKISEDSKKTKQYLKNIIDTNKFPTITFDDAVNILVENDKKELVNFTEHGNDISSDGEIELMKILKANTPIWMTSFDRDRVPFYQKPNPKNPEKTINADLLFPPIIENSFGGEIVGSGQRQDNTKEMYESLKRQNVFSGSYEWYIDLRNSPSYEVTSGFGLGVERFIAWSLGKDNIRDVILYPRIKNVRTYP